MQLGKMIDGICSELGYGVVDGVGGHTRCLRDGICPELRGGDIPSESEKVVEKGVPLQTPRSKTQLRQWSMVVCLMPLQKTGTMLLN